MRKEAVSVRKTAQNMSSPDGLVFWYQQTWIKDRIRYLLIEIYMNFAIDSP